MKLEVLGEFDRAETHEKKYIGVNTPTSANGKRRLDSGCIGKLDLLWKNGISKEKITAGTEVLE